MKYQLTQDAFLQVVLDIINHEHQSKPKLNLDFMIENYSKKEIKIFLRYWEECDDVQDKMVNIKIWKKLIEQILTHYKNASIKNSQIDEFINLKVHKHQYTVSLQEHLIFLCDFIKKNKYTLKKKVCSCF